MRNSKVVRWTVIAAGWLIPCLVVVATTFLWFNDATLSRFTDQPQQWLGVITTVALWAMLLGGATVLLRLRVTSRQLETLRLRRELETATLTPPDEKAMLMAGLRSVPAWLVLVLGVVVTIVVTAFAPQLLASNEHSGLWLGVAINVVVWMLVLANTANRIIARRTRAEARTARRGEARALETVQSLGVMVSACSPEGSRRRFNAAYRAFAGRTDAELDDRGWLDCVQPDDREQVLGTIVNHTSKQRERLKLEYMLLGADGEYRWICEYLTPRFGPDGALIEYIACATDMTDQVQTETEHQEAADTLQKEVDRLRKGSTELASRRDELMGRVADAEEQAATAIKAQTTIQKRFDKLQAKTSSDLDAARSEVKQLKSDLRSVTKERETARAEAERAGTNAARLEQEVANLKASDTTLREELEQARSDLKTSSQLLAEKSSEYERAAGSISRHEQTVEALQTTERALREQLEAVQPERDEARRERDEALAESQRLADHAATLEQTIEQLRESHHELREQMSGEEARFEKSRAESDDARRTATQHRAKISKLTARCEELEQQLAAAGGGAEAVPVNRTAAADATEANASMDHEFSAELSLGLNSIARINEQLRVSSLDEMQRSFVENAQASIDVMTALVGSVIGGDGVPRDGDVQPVRAFDLRAAAKGACDLLDSAATQRRVKLRSEVDVKVPPLVVADPVRLRRVLMYLINSALQVVDEGEVLLKITAEGVLSAHATIRFEISHPSARIAADRMEQIFSLKDAGSASAPAQRQAADAWRMISELQGQFAFNLPENGGFSVWFNLTLPRLTAMKAEAEADSPAAFLATNDQSNAVQAVDPPSFPASAPITSEISSDDSLLAGIDDDSKLPNIARSAPLINHAVSPRMPQELLECNLGPVIELGADSIRVQVSRVPKEPITVELPMGDTTVTLDAEVLSTDRSGLRKHEIVLRFTNVDESTRKQIMQVVFDHRAGATLMPMDQGEPA